MSLVTVIVPVYNAGAYIDRCIKSVLRQTYEDFVLLLIVDGSEDDSLEKCMKWEQADKRVSVVKKEHDGPGPSRNLGVKLAGSEYVTFLDSDDWWTEDYLEKMLIAAEKYSVDIVCGAMKYINVLHDEYIYKDSYLRLPEGKLNLEREWNLFNCARTFMWGKLFKRRLFIDNKIFQPPHAFEDIAVMPLLLALAESVACVNVPMYCYLHNRQGSLSHDFSQFGMLLLSLSEVKQEFIRRNLLKKYNVQIRHFFWSQIVSFLRRLDGIFNEENADMLEMLASKSDELIAQEYPELSRMKELVFFVGENSVLEEAVGKLITHKSAIVKNNDAAMANVVVRFVSEEYDSNVLSPNYLEIVLDDWTTEEENDYETRVWNLSDEIFRRLWE